MSTITLPRIEYQELKKKAAMFERIVELAEKDNLFSPPPIRSRRQIVSAFKKTKKYNPAFLQSLNRGLKRSDYFIS
ncbi:MAG: hypothetical protein V1704_03580 [Candidatus Vogelbacteria bacterium]